MANINVPKQDGDDQKKPVTKQNRSIQERYTQQLAYERAFLKKKEELENGASIRQLKAEIELIQKRAKEDLDTAQSLISDKEALEQELARLRLNLASELADKQIQLLAERRESEYAAHQFAASCAMKSFQTQNVHQRAQTASALADAHKVQTEKLRSIKETQIADLQAQKKSAASEEERLAIATKIKQLRKDIRDSEKESTKAQELAVEYSNIVKKVEFDRLSASEKLAAKQEEIKSLQEESASISADFQSQIAAKKVDKSTAESKGNDAAAAKLQQEIDALEAKQAESETQYAAAVAEITTLIEAPGGLQEEASKFQGAKTVNVSPEVTSENVSETSQLVSQLSQLAASLSEFVTAFDTYVSTIDAKMTSDAVIAAALSQQTTGTTVGGSAIVNHLRELVSETSEGDIDLQTELNNKLEQLSLVLQSSSDADIQQLSELLTFTTLTSVMEELLAATEEQISQDEESEEKKEKSTHLKTADERVADMRSEWVEGKTDADRTDAKNEREANLKFLTAKDSEGRWIAGVNAAQNALNGAMDALRDALSQVDKNISNYFKDQAKIDAKLQGTDLTYSKALSTLTRNLNLSMVIPQSEYIEKFKQVVDAGISHNIETRTFLSTVSDKIVSTFDAFDASLNRLIRLQQADSTAARLGLESVLNKFLNSMFSDSSYLSQSGPHDTVSGSILEASSLLSKTMSLEFEFAVHKWLGALYSLGMSTETVNKIAQGLNYLGTGNVTALSNDASLQTLMAMSAVRGGVPYTEILTNGLSASNTDKLLSGMLNYLMEIANNTNNNQVVKSAYSDVFGLSMSDLRAISNLTQSDIASLSKLNTSYSDAVGETESQLHSIVSRTHFSTLLENLWENAVLGSSLTIGNNPVTYGLWKALNLVEDLTGGISLPFVNIYGFGVDLNTTVTELAKGGMMGLSLLGNLLSALTSGNLDGMSLSSWNHVEETSRGSVSGFVASGATSGTSSSGRLDYVGSGSGSDIKRTEMSDGADSGQEDSEVTNKHVSEGQEVPEKILELVEIISSSVQNEETTLLEETIKMSQSIDSLKELLSPNRLFLTTGSGFFSTEYNSSSKMLSVTDESLASFQTVNTLLSDVISSVAPSTSSRNIWSAIVQNPYRLLSNGKVSTDAPLSASDMLSDEEKLIVTRLQEELNSVTNKKELVNEINRLAEAQNVTRVLFPEHVLASVTIDELSSTVKKYIEGLVQAAVRASVNGTEMYGDEEIDNYDLPPSMKYLKTVLDQVLKNSASPVYVTDSTDTIYGGMRI